MSDQLRRRRLVRPDLDDTALMADAPFPDDDEGGPSASILAEHPELANASDEQRVVVLPDGTRLDPLFHVTMHELAMSALWRDDPPEAWTTAQRLLDAGYERHEILHMVGFAKMGDFFRGLVAALEPEPGSPDRDPAPWEDLPDAPSQLAAMPGAWERYLADARDDADRRRDFAVPPRSAADDAVPSLRADYADIGLSLLDREDEDDRTLLIEAEHPEYEEALDSGEEILGPDGQLMNPRLHVTLHAVIANQLMADDPPEVWDTAKRLLDLGYERHEVLHMLMSAVSTHILSAMRGGAPAGEDDYLDLLDELPESWYAVVDTEAPIDAPPRPPVQPRAESAKKERRPRRGASGRPRGRKRRK